MTTDIKELRGTERLIRLDCLFDGKAGCACSHCEASDTIARLAAERDRLAGEVERLKSQRDEYLQFWKNNAEACEAAEAERDRLAKSEEGLLKTLGLERREKHAAQTERDRMKVALEEAVKWMDGCAVSGGYPTWHAKARKALGGDA